MSTTADPLFFHKYGDALHTADAFRKFRTDNIYPNEQRLSIWRAMGTPPPYAAHDATYVATSHDLCFPATRQAE